MVTSERGFLGRTGLPKTWKLLKLGEIISLEYGKSLPEVKRDSMGIVPVYGSNGRVGFHSVPLVDEPCLIVGRKGSAGQVHLTKEPCWPIDTTYYVLPPKDVDLRFLYFLLSSLNLSSLDRSTAIPGLNRNDAYALEVPVPPYEEQKTIVERLEELFSNLDFAVSALQRVQSNLKRYKASVLKAACEGRLAPTEAELARREGREYESGADLLRRILDERRKAWETEQRSKGKDPGKMKYEAPRGPRMEGLPDLPEGWVWASPDQLASASDYALAIGPFGSNLKVSDYQDKGVPLIFVRNIRSGIFGSDTHFVSENKASELRPHQVLGGDILITKMGEPPGDAILYPKGSPKAIITADCVKWTLSSILNTSQFFVDITNSKIIQEQISRITRGVAQKKISLGRFKEIAYPLPPLNEQVRITIKVEEELILINKSDEIIQKNLVRADRLRQSILKRAFEGRLVGNDTQPLPSIGSEKTSYHQTGLF